MARREPIRSETEPLARDALRWLLDSARPTSNGLAWSGTRDDAELDPTLYSGTSGIIVTLLEGWRHFQDEAYADAALAGARYVASAIDDVDRCSLYFGLTGMAFALASISREMNDSESAVAAARALALVRSRFDGERWGDQFELLGGNAGIALGALAVGDLDLSVMAVVPYMRRAEPTPGGVHWEVRDGTPARFHHISHGTLGIVAALATVGSESGREDLVSLALAGAADVVGRSESGPGGFLVPHSDPQHRPDVIERYSFGWCHGPAGDAQAFRILESVTGDPAWRDLSDRCWHTVTHSGIPRRLRPGFWDNGGRCCGTAGVLALAGDRLVERGDSPGFAQTLVDDLTSRADVDDDGARWSNHEHRATPSDLEPRTGWAMGSAGIVRELLRYSRITSRRDPHYVVAWPDHLPVPTSILSPEAGVDGP